MAIVVDTCSLVMIAKNYLPLDKDGQLYSFLEEAFSRKDLMLLDVIQVTFINRLIINCLYNCIAYNMPTFLIYYRLFLT